MRIWTEDKIEQEIKYVMKELEIDRMPTTSEIILVEKNTCLTNAIRRNNGLKFWTKKLNLEQSKCETRLGLKGEILIKEYLESIGFNVKKMSVKHPYDLLVNENIKIDVKTANKSIKPNFFGTYSFNLEKKNPTCDIYVFVCLDSNYVEKILVIPSKFLHQTQLNIGHVSKYDKYKNRWEYISQFDYFYKKVI